MTDRDLMKVAALSILAIVAIIGAVEHWRATKWKALYRLIEYGDPLPPDLSWRDLDHVAGPVPTMALFAAWIVVML